MAQLPLPPPPVVKEDPLQRWLNLLWKRVNSAGQVLWSYLDFRGSDLADLEKRRYSDLQDIPARPVFFPEGGEEGGEDWLSRFSNLSPPPNTTGLEIRQEVTGVLSGGLLTATPGGTTFSISDGTGQIVDSYSTPLAPRITGISWQGLTAITDSYLSGEVTYVSVNAAGTVIQATTMPTQDALRSQLLVGYLIHSGGAIRNIVPNLVTAYQNGYLAQDLMAALGTITSGCVYSGGAGLTLARSAGRLFRRGADYATDLATPNEVSLGAVAPANTETHCRNGSNTVFSASPIVTSLNVAVYDNGAAASAGVPSGTVSTNQWQAMRLHLSTTGVAVVQYGQAVYNSLANAQAGVGAEVFYQDPLLVLPAFRGYMFVRGGASNLSDPGDAVFQSAGKLGDVASGSGGGATGPVGPQGPQGLTGFGLDGLDGEDGIGIPGPRGLDGRQGMPGVSLILEGEQGEDGFPVPVPGPQGPSGPQGVQGTQGLQGLPGTALLLEGECGEDGFGVPGPPGPAGPAGPSGGGSSPWVLAFAAAHG
jgi:hypothetical protein